MRKNLFLSTLATVALVGWSCTSGPESSLQTSLDNNAATLSTALNNITSSTSYQVLATPSVSGSAAAAAYAPAVDSTYTTINLADIAGEYEFNKAKTYRKFKQPITVFFTKVADNAKMIVRLPVEKLRKPNTLFLYNPSDTLLTNNYVYTLGKYYYSYNRSLGWNYDMASTINIDGTDAGALDIQSSNSSAAGYKFASGFDFGNGYSIKTQYTTGDTAVSVYSVYQGSTALYQETHTAIKSSGRHREREYTLTIGNVSIVRKAGPNSLDSAKVYVGGVLQASAKVELVDLSSSDNTDVSIVSKKREIKITFDDGTSKTVSELLGTSITTIRELFATLRQSYYATSIVDRIAVTVYNSSN